MNGKDLILGNLIGYFLEKFPSLFADEESIVRARGVECGPGWVGLLDDTFEALGEVAKADGVPVPHIIQIKEKLGVLRIYCRGATDSMKSILDGAMRNSTTICEACGDPGAMCVSKYGRMATLCKKHELEMNCE